MRAVVVGGGVIGAASAWRLARRGVQVTLLDRYEAGHARGASHGSSRILRHAYDSDVYTALAVVAGQMWDELDCAARGAPVLTRTGSVDHGPSAVTVRRAAALDRVNLRYRLLDPREARKVWPQMRFDTSVLFNPNAGRLHADRAVASLVARAQCLGADVRRPARVLSIRPQTCGATVTTDRGVIDTDWVVVAAGAWTEDVLRCIDTDCGDLVAATPTLRTTREQPAHFVPFSDADRSSAPDGPWPSFVHHPGGELDEAYHLGGIYGLSSDDGIKVGEHATGPEVTADMRDYVIDPANEERLSDYVAEWIPGVDATSARSVTCLYTCTADHNFVVDTSENIAVAAGFSGHGFEFAPAIGEYVADMVTGVSTLPALGLGSLFGFGDRVAL